MPIRPRGYDTDTLLRIKRSLFEANDFAKRIFPKEP